MFLRVEDRGRENAAALVECVLQRPRDVAVADGGSVLFDGPADLARTLR